MPKDTPKYIGCHLPPELYRALLRHKHELETARGGIEIALAVVVRELLATHPHITIASEEDNPMP